MTDITQDGKVTLNEILEGLQKGVESSGKKLEEALEEMNGSDDIGPEKLLAVQRLTSIWTTFVSQTTTMGKAVADASKSIVRNYN